MTDVMAKYVIEKNGGTAVYHEGTNSVDITLYGKTVSYSLADNKTINDRLILDTKTLCADFNLENDSGIVHNAGDKFETEADAAIAFGLMYNGKSQLRTQEHPIGVEYAANIYKEGEKTFTFRQITTDMSANSVAPLNFDSEYGTRVGIAHTHAAYSPSYNSEEFSENDRQLAWKNKANAYVATPGGLLLKYDILGTPFETTQITSSMPKDYLYN